LNYTRDWPSLCIDSAIYQPNRPVGEILP